MKTYFAKYLPVEGRDIYQGDKYYDSELDQVLTATLPPENYSFPHLKRVKLFLCSRDIQVGDECYHIDFIDMGAWTNRGDSIPDCVDWHGENVDPDKLFKIIGEISRHAYRYVTEGDEFDEEDVRKEITTEVFNQERDEQFETRWTILSVDKTYVPKENEVILFEEILIKGCCGHFH